jgi:hypothetical protein
MSARFDCFSSRSGHSFPHKDAAISIENNLLCQGIFIALAGIS